MEASDSSHSGMVEVATWWRRVGLDGAEVAKRGWRRESKSALRFELRGEERGGVTGALLDILRGGRLAGMEVMLRMTRPSAGHAVSSKCMSMNPKVNSKCIRKVDLSDKKWSKIGQETILSIDLKKSSRASNTSKKMGLCPQSKAAHKKLGKVFLYLLNR